MTTRAAYLGVFDQPVDDVPLHLVLQRAEDIPLVEADARALGDRLRVDVGQHDGRVVAAKLQGEPGHVPRRRLDDLHPGLDRTGEHHLADARVANQGVAHVAVPGDGGQHAGRQRLVEDRRDGQAGERGVLARLAVARTHAAQPAASYLAPSPFMVLPCSRLTT